MSTAEKMYTQAEVDNLIAEKVATTVAQRVNEKNARIQELEGSLATVTAERDNFKTAADTAATVTAERDQLRGQLEQATTGAASYRTLVQLGGITDPDALDFIELARNKYIKTSGTDINLADFIKEGGPGRQVSAISGLFGSAAATTQQTTTATQAETTQQTQAATTTHTPDKNTVTAPLQGGGNVKADQAYFESAEFKALSSKDKLAEIERRRSAAVAQAQRVP